MNHLVQNLEDALDAEPAASSGSGERRISRRDVPKSLLAVPTHRGLLRMACEETLLMAAFWTGMAWTPAWLYPVWALLLAGRFHALGVVLHDAAHMPLRGKSAAIRCVEILCGYPIATTLNAMRYHHLRHHRDTGMRTDPYHKPGEQDFSWWFLNIARGMALVPFWSLRGCVGAATSIFPRLRVIYGRIFLQDRSGDDLNRSQEIRDCARAEWGQIGFQAALLALAAFSGKAFLFGYVVPVTLAGLLAAHRVVIEHTHADVLDRRVDTLLDSTRDNFLGWVGKLGLAPRNIGYHIVHHIHPQVALSALPRLRQWYAENYPDRYPKGNAGTWPAG